FDTSRPAIVTLHTQGPDGERTAQPERTAALQHNVPVVDLRAQSTYDAWVTVDNGANTTTSNKVKLTTGALPRDFPPMTTKSDPTRMAPGVTLFTITSLVAPPPEPGVAPPLLGNLVAVDATGHVVWYHRDPLPIGDARMIANGDLLYEYNNMGAREIDIMGHLVHEWAGRLERGPLAKDEYGRTVAGTDAIPVDVDSMHHEVSELSNGDILTISTELLTIGGFTKPACGEPISTFTGHYTVITDMIVEFQPGTGKVVQRWPLVNVLHPATNPADGPICGPSGIPPSAYPLFLYPGRNALDWTHVNAVILDQTHNELLVSIRHLDTVMALRYHTDASGPAGQMIWRFGPRATDFKMTGNGLWQYHQHAIELEHDGTLQMFDNGNDRPGTKELFSRAVRYKIVDTGPKSQWTATQVWEFRPTIDGTPVYAFFVGDADTLPNGNVLIDSGGITPAIKKVVAQIVEVVPASSGSGGDVVFDLRVSGPPAFVYRAERLPSMYGASERDS
ncbi:MAG TPA: aryl-sulfate sulfotransferase, partial [Acidimicrobiia bacterium]|nr:aryl-sulfate sulfotransferase [Acidimicrobiia bacterium]